MNNIENQKPDYSQEVQGGEDQLKSFKEYQDAILDQNIDTPEQIENALTQLSPLVEQVWELDHNIKATYEEYLRMSTSLQSPEDRESFLTLIEDLETFKKDLLQTVENILPSKTIWGQTEPEGYLEEGNPIQKANPELAQVAVRLANNERVASRLLSKVSTMLILAPKPITSEEQQAQANFHLQLTRRGILLYDPQDTSFDDSADNTAEHIFGEDAGEKKKFTDEMKAIYKEKATDELEYAAYFRY